MKCFIIPYLHNDGNLTMLRKRGYHGRVETNWLTPAEVAKQKGVSKTAVYSAISRGSLTAHRMLGRLAVSEEDAARWQPVLDLTERARRGGLAARKPA